MDLKDLLKDRTIDIEYVKMKKAPIKFKTYDSSLKYHLKNDKNFIPNNFLKTIVEQMQIFNKNFKVHYDEMSEDSPYDL